MASRFDVAARLAEGRPAVQHAQSYLRACHVLGYQHPELTVHAAQVCAWYDSEDGLDLHVLDDDCAELRAAASLIEQALRLQRAQIAELAAAWTGPGADSAIGFLQRHCDAGDAVAGGVRAAAQDCAALRDNLWQIIDAKVATAIAIDDRRLAERPAWLAAAEVVTTGTGDRSTADEIVDQQIKPYVDNDIRTDWLTAMRSAQASVAASYDAVTDELTSAPPGRFEIPDDLGPSYRLLLEQHPRVPTVAAPAAPSGVAAVPPAGGPTSDALETMPEDLLSALPMDRPPPLPLPSLPAGGLEGLTSAAPISDLSHPLGDGGGLPTGGGSPGDLGGLAGIAGRIVDAIGGLVGSLTDGLNDPSGFDDPLAADDPFDAADDPFDAGDEPADHPPDDEEPGDGQDKDVAADEADHVDNPGTSEESTPEGGPVGKPAEEPVEEGVAQGPTPEQAAAPPPAEPSTPAPPAEGSTPCEIAAEELPRAGQ